MAIFSTTDGVQCPEIFSHSTSPICVENTDPDRAHPLLDALWRSPNRCHQIGTLDRGTKQFKHIPVKDASEAAELAVQLSGRGIDVYFACAEYLTSKNRQAANASGAWGFWLDIDCGAAKAAAGAGYATCEDALQAVADFCIKAELPLPTHIVNSGSGLHVYWALVSVVPSEFWPTNAQKLKALTKALGFLADDTRTADIASVLRVPGTLNFKYEPPRPVKLIFAAPDFIRPSTMLRAIHEAHGRLCQAATSRHSISSNDASARHASKVPTGTGSTLTKQAKLRLLQAVLVRLDPDIGYRDWFTVAAGVYNETGGCEEAFELFDRWSSTGKKYKGVRDTRNLWRSLRPDHPTPITMASLHLMVEANGHDWLEVYASAEDGFPVIDNDAEGGN